MAKYNVVFQYLLRLKRIQVDLESSWAVMRRQAGRSRDMSLHTRRLPLWHLRHHMAYIIANLQIYVQVRPHVTAHMTGSSVVCQVRNLLSNSLQSFLPTQFGMGWLITSIASVTV